VYESPSHDNSKKRLRFWGPGVIGALPSRAVRAKRVAPGEPVRLRALLRIFISRTADSYVLASIEKLGTVCSYKVTGLSEVAGIITDAPAGEPTVRQLREDRVTIIEA
jgi:hypothetical protein